MKIAKHIPAYLLAFVFVVFGVMFFLKLMPTPAMTGDQLSFMTLFGGSGYMTFIKVLEVAFGVLLIFPKTRAMGLLLILPIVVNILCFELFIAKQPGIGVALLIINVVGIYFNREKYQGILA
jgi:putative oxidoreductase